MIEDTQTRSPFMGWIGVVTNRGLIYCWSCAIRLKHVGLMLRNSDVWLADDQCDRCGCNILTGEHPPAPTVTRQLVEAGCYVAPFSASECDKPGINLAPLPAAIAFGLLGWGIGIWVVVEALLLG